MISDKDKNQNITLDAVAVSNLTKQTTKYKQWINRMEIIIHGNNVVRIEPKFFKVYLLSDEELNV